MAFGYGDQYPHASSELFPVVGLVWYLSNNSDWILVFVYLMKCFFTDFNCLGKNARVNCSK